jgi:signal transduction histidine kinase
MQAESLRTEGWDVTYDESLGSDRLPAALETALFRVALEALTNIRKHARTTRIHLCLAQEGGRVRLEVRDWGCGFDPTALAASPDGLGHIGLREMRDRVELLSGAFAVSSRPGDGCRVTAEVPAPARPLQPEPSVANGAVEAGRERGSVA